MNPPKILSATAIDDYTLVVEFDNRQKKEFDITPLTRESHVLSLKEPRVFQGSEDRAGRLRRRVE